MTATDAATEADAPPRWGLVDVVLGFLFAQIASVIGFTLFAAVKGVPVTDLTTEALTIGEVALLQIPLWCGLLGVPLVSAHVRGNGPVADFGWRMTLGDVPRGLGLGVLCQLVLVPIVSIPVVLLADADQDELEAPARELTDKATSGGAGVLVLVLVVVVAAPLAEELFYRGLLQRTLLRSMPTWLALVVTSVAFGASHFQALQFPALVAFGLVLSIVAHRTGRLGLNTWAHVGFNATTVVVLLSQT